MKKLFIIIFVLSYCSQLFAVCESEQLMYDRSKKEFERWCLYSGISVIGGEIVNSSFGGLTGFIPGLVAWQMKILLVANEDQLKKCVERNAKAGEATMLSSMNNKVIEKQSELLGKLIGDQLDGVISTLRQQCDDEINAYIKSFADSGIDLTDPQIMKEIEAGVSEIVAKYF
ncbi:MAG: hypothetical protein HQK52_20545 [Oligoflexia bacterium]|nr:hypothetical protein [Oligoflexia bacterium]